MWSFGFWRALGLHYVKSGPFAWNGAISFWLGAVAIYFGVALNTIYLLRAVETPDDPVLPNHVEDTTLERIDTKPGADPKQFNDRVQDPELPKEGNIVTA